MYGNIYKKLKFDVMNFCEKCGKKISNTAQLCEKCYHESTRKVEFPQREQLKYLIRNTPFTKIGIQFGVSDNAIRKWCKSMNLPYKAKEIKQYTNEEWNNI